VEHAVAAGSVVADGNKDEPLLQNDGVYYDSLSYKILTTSQATYHIQISHSFIQKMIPMLSMQK